MPPLFSFYNKLSKKNSPLNNKSTLATLGDELLSILLAFLQRMDFDLKKFHLKDSSQKFRIATKIVDELNVK